MEKKKGAFRTSIGGQALIEGIPMRGPEKDAIVVRSPEGLVTKVTQRKFVKANYPILGVPILRGAVTFIGSMITGVSGAEHRLDAGAVYAAAYVSGGAVSCHDPCTP